MEKNNKSQPRIVFFTLNDSGQATLDRVDRNENGVGLPTPSRLIRVYGPLFEG